MDNLQFLEDVIPQTVTYKDYKAKKASKGKKTSQPLQNGQTTLGSSMSLPQRLHETVETQQTPVEDTTMSDITAEEQAAQAQRPGSSKAIGDGLVFEHYEPNSSSKPNEAGDIEMG